MQFPPRGVRATAVLLATHRRRCHRPKPHHKPAAPPSKPVYMRSIITTISNILRYSTWDSAQSQLRSLPVRWDSYTINQVLKTHPPMDKAWLFFGWAARMPGFKHDRFTYTTMLDIFGEAGRIRSMRKVFEEMLERGIEVDVATYTSVMHWMAKDGDFEGAVRAWGEMRRSGCRPTVVSYTAIMKVLFDHGRPQEAAGVYREMIESGVVANCHTYTVLMEYLAGAGNFAAALDIMTKMQEAGVQPDKATCNILVQKCSQARETSAMFQVLYYMKEHSIVLRRPVFLEALEALKSSGQSDQLLREVNPHLALEGIEEERADFEEIASNVISFTDRGIILSLLARKNLIAVDHLLSGMIEEGRQLDSELISAIIQANCQHSRSSGALRAFQLSKDMGRKLNKTVYISLIGLFIRENSYQKVLNVVEEMINNRINLGTYLVSLLIYRLGFSGMPAFAAKIFYSSPEDHNTVTCTALIYAYFRAGEIDKGLEQYLTMRKKSIPPSLVTYEVLISGLEKIGRINDAEICRKEKKQVQLKYSLQEGVSKEEILSNCLFGRCSF